MSKFSVSCSVCHGQFELNLPDFNIGDLTHEQGALICCRQCGLPILYNEGEWELLDVESMMSLPDVVKASLVADMMKVLRHRLAEHDATISGPKQAPGGGLIPQGGDPGQN